MTEHSISPLAAEFLPIAQGQHSIDSYRDRLCALYTETDMQHLDLDHWKMTELRTYRNKYATVKNKNLIATFTDGRKGKVHLCIARQIQDVSSPPPDNGTQIEQLGTRVIDRVSLYPDHRLENDITAEHIKFCEGPRISLPRFVLLACAVRECTRGYPLARTNCYWFCSAMTEALKARYPNHHLLPAQGRKQQVTGFMPLVDKLYRNVNVDELFDKANQMWNQYLGQL